MRIHRVGLLLACAGLGVTAAALAQPQPGGGRPDAANRPAQPGADPAAFADRQLQRDADGDGKLSKDEMPGQFAERLFAEFDADKDGKLSRDELMKFAEQRTQQGPAGPAQQGAAAGFDSGMRLAGRGLRGLSRSTFTAETRERDLQAVQALQSGLIAAKGDLASAPRSDAATAKYPDNDAYLTAMRQRLLEIMRESITLEMAILDAKSDAASASARRISQMHEDSHALFQPPEDGPGEGAAGGGGRAPRRGGAPGRG